MSFRKTVTFTAFSSDDPAASAIALRFSSTRAVCFATSPSTNCPVAGSNATCPDKNTNPPALIACEYGPIAFGPFSVAITCFTFPPVGFGRWMIFQKTDHGAVRNTGLLDCEFSISLFRVASVAGHRVRFLQLSFIPRAKIPRDSLNVEPLAKNFSQRLSAGSLERRTQIVVSHFLASQQCDQVPEPLPHRGFSANVLDGHKKERCFREANAALRLRIGQHRYGQRLFRATADCEVILVEISQDALAAALGALARFFHDDRRVFRQTLAKPQTRVRAWIQLATEPVVRQRVRHKLHEFIAVNSKSESLRIHQRAAGECGRGGHQPASHMRAQAG